jgi:DNA-binding protein HU-beta
MTKDELAREVAGRTGLTRKEVLSVLENLLEVISESLCRDEKVFLRGFGCFETRQGKRRRARDPRGEGIISIPPKARATFRPYDGLKNAVEGALSPKVVVDFLCLGASTAGYVSVVGSFNDWKEDRTPMQKLPDGSWVAEVRLPQGQSISYMYNVDGEWRPDRAFPRDGKGRTVRQI